MRQIRAERLQSGDQVLFIAPGSRVAAHNVSLAVQRYQALGLQVRLQAEQLQGEGYFAAPAAQCLDSIHAGFADPAIKAIVALRGGYGSARLLPDLDFKLISENPKIFLGCSDVTALLNAIHCKTGLITFHGPNANSPLSKPSLSYLQQTLFTAQKVHYTNYPKKNSDDDIIARSSAIYTITKGEATGQLIGGNFSVFNSLLGSNYLPQQWEDKILFLEEIGEDVYRIDRLFCQLQLAGILPQLRAIVLGSFKDYSHKLCHSFSLTEVIERYIKPLQIPAFMGAMFGHQKDMFTLPIGAEVSIDANEGSIRLLQPAVQALTVAAEENSYASNEF